MTDGTSPAPAVWPSYSDLARIVRMSVSGFGRYVRSQHVEVEAIGREKRVAPPKAVLLLEGRGLTRPVAEREVSRVVESRKAEFPVLEGETPEAITDHELLKELSLRYEAMLARMQEPKARRRMRAAFASITPQEMGRSAVAAAPKRRPVRQHV
ncbi:MAG TPA: hypothetical protein VIO86_07570 [Candidatus Dormibacteraeota bacterium]